MRNLLFRGLHLAHSDWNLVEIEGSHGKASVQGACHFSAFTMLEVNCHLNLYRNFDVPPGAIQCEHCDHVGFLRNKIEHLAAEGIAPNDASHVRSSGMSSGMSPAAGSWWAIPSMPSWMITQTRGFPAGWDPRRRSIRPR